MARTPQHLKKRKLGWYVQLAVPRAYQSAVGAKVLTRSLQTQDVNEANRRKHAVLADLHSFIAQRAALSSTSAPPQSNADDLLQAALEARDAIRRGELDEEDTARGLDASIDAFLEAQARLHGLDSEGQPQVPPEVVSKVRRAKAAVSGRLELTLGFQVERYLAEQVERLTAQTIVEKRRRLSAFLEWFGGDRECAEVTRTVAGSYVSEVIQRRTQKDADGKETPLSPTTRTKEVSDLRSFFDWLTARGLVEANPFDRMSATVKGSTRGKAPSRRPWKPEELSKVLHGVPTEDPLWALTALAAYTGMRREEIGELRVSSVDGTALLVEEGKTAAAVRRIPIHPVIAPLVKRLAKVSDDGYLIPGLLRGGPDEKRAWYLGKRFGRVIRKLGVADPALDFHALRGTVITQLENRGVPESTIQLIVGHRRQGVTLGVYSAGVSDKVKREAIGKITFGKLDQYVSEEGEKVTVRASAAPRKKRSS